MIDEHNVVAVSRFDGDAYKSSQTAELILNAAILRAEMEHGWSIREISRALNISHTAVKSRLYTARKQLSTSRAELKFCRPSLIWCVSRRWEHVHQCQQCGDTVEKHQVLYDPEFRRARSSRLGLPT
jgi:hypothetical protein